MIRYTLFYGLLSGSTAILGIIATIVFGIAYQWLGYLIMLIAFSAIYVAVVRYREEVQGGVLRFSTGLWVGLAISLIASLAYLSGWELYLFLTDYSFASEYVDTVIAAQQANGVDEVALQNLRADMDEFADAYSYFPFRAAMSFVEIFPVGLLVSVVSAAILKK